MGIKGLHAFFKKHQLINYAKELIATEDIIYIDVFGCFFNILIRNFAKDKNWNGFSEWLYKSLPNRKYYLVIDGSHTIQKGLAHAARLRKADDDLHRLNKIIQSSEDSTKLSRAKWKKIESLVSRTIKLSS